MTACIARDVLKKDELGLEIAQIAIPAALALAADPVASLIDTAFIGQLGPIELAAVGVSIALFNQISRITIFPLVSVTTSFVAEEDAIEAEGNGSLEKGLLNDVEMEELIPKLENTQKPSSLSRSAKSTEFESDHRRHIPSASLALAIGSVLGISQMLLLLMAAKPLLSYMGINSDSPMLIPAQQYLTLRSLGAPAILLSLAIQGIFRGIRDTKTPLYATIVGDLANIVLDPILMFVFRLGVSGAAIAHVISQYTIALILLWRLIKEVDLRPPNASNVQFERFLKTGAFAKNDHEKATATASRVLQLSLVLGLGLSVIVALLLQFGSRLFTKDTNVLQLMGVSLLFVAGTQPINALAFVFDGVNYGASDFTYAAYSMVLVAIIGITSLFILSSSYGYIGIWVALTIYMSLRAVAGFDRDGEGTLEVS
ncbi:hypothetical protein ACFE04_003191 [Oxalis oulophora]